MSVITHVPEPNLWDVICKEVAAEQEPFKDADNESVHTTIEDYDPAKHNPVFYGKMVAGVTIDSDVVSGFDPSVGHPSLIGHAILDRPPARPPPASPPPPPRDTCSPTLYLEKYIFPVLLPALEDMLKEAKQEMCFERKRTKFNALDFLTEYLYSKNPSKEGREDMKLADIPFVSEWWKDHPRPPLPKSLLWNEEEATLIIQSHWRGFKVRRESEIQELRHWQKEWREENANIGNKVQDFWAHQMPDSVQEEEDEKDEVEEEENEVAEEDEKEGDEGEDEEVRKLTEDQEDIPDSLNASDTENFTDDELRETAEDVDYTEEVSQEQSLDD